MTIPSPSAAFPLRPRRGADEKVYPVDGGFLRDLGEAYRKAVRAFADAGCRYLQLDEVNLAYLCDPSCASRWQRAATIPKSCRTSMRELINAAMSDIPDDMTITCICAAAISDRPLASGGYEPVAEILFNTIKVHGYFMEYDTERAGGFEPLRFVPKGKTVVLGLVTTKSGDAGEAGTRSSAASTRPRNIIASTSSASRRNAASPRPRRAMCWPKSEQWAKLAHDRGDRGGSLGIQVIRHPECANSAGLEGRRPRHCPCHPSRLAVLAPQG